MPTQPPSEEILELMRDYDLDEDTAERAQELMEEYDVDEDDAVEMVEDMLGWIFIKKLLTGRFFGFLLY